MKIDNDDIKRQMAFSGFPSEDQEVSQMESYLLSFFSFADDTFSKLPQSDLSVTNTTDQVG